MQRIDGSPILAHVPEQWASGTRDRTVARSRSSSTRSLRSTPSTGESCGLGDLAHAGDYLPRQITRWLAQLASYERPRAARPRSESRNGSMRTDPPINRARCATATTSSTTCCSPPSRRRSCSPSSIGRWPAIGDPLVDLAWALIFHPGPEGTIPLGMSKEPTFALRIAARSPPARRPLRAEVGPRHGGDRLVRRVRALEARDRARGQLRQVPPRANPTSRSTSSSACRPICCSRAPSTIIENGAAA